MHENIREMVAVSQNIEELEAAIVVLRFEIGKSENVEEIYVDQFTWYRRHRRRIEEKEQKEILDRAAEKKMWEEESDGGILGSLLAQE